MVKRNRKGLPNPYLNYPPPPPKGEPWWYRRVPNGDWSIPINPRFPNLDALFAGLRGGHSGSTAPGIKDNKPDEQVEKDQPESESPDVDHAIKRLPSILSETRDDNPEMCAEKGPQERVPENPPDDPYDFGDEAEGSGFFDNLDHESETGGDDAAEESPETPSLDDDQDPEEEGLDDEEAEESPDDSEEDLPEDDEDSTPESDEQEDADEGDRDTGDGVDGEEDADGDGRPDGDSGYL